ncbi:hypothetical protein H4R33_001003 [Dimargaris cristalligena]|nr:hypothetical protein H4R33_001003 [Dimargaris cristalligena]
MLSIKLTATLLVLALVAGSLTGSRASLPYAPVQNDRNLVSLHRRSGWKRLFDFLKPIAIKSVKDVTPYDKIPGIVGNIYEICKTNPTGCTAQDREVTRNVQAILKGESAATIAKNIVDYAKLTEFKVFNTEWAEAMTQLREDMAKNAGTNAPTPAGPRKT